MRILDNIFRAFLVGALSFQLASCGTILYPERKGQKSGKLDVGVVLLDAVGLLFFFIPGIIAFAVDFSNGTIYLPPGKAGLDNDKYKTAKFDRDNYTPESLEALISKETGTDFHFNDEQLQYIKLKDADEISFRFNEFQPTRLSLSVQ